MSTGQIINSDVYKLHIDLNSDLDSQGTKIYYILNNNSDENINCVFNLFLSTSELGKTVTINLEQYDNDILRVSEYLSLTSSAAYIQKTINLYTQLLKITFTSTNFDGHIFGNIKKTQVTTISTTSTTTSINVNFDKMTYDAFGRLRISDPFTLFDAQNRYSKSSKFTEYTNGSAATHNKSDSTVSLTVANTQGRMVIRESKTVFPYQPGKSLLIMNTFAFNDTSGNNLIQRVGYYTNYDTSTAYTAPYNPKNGIYLDASGTTISLCKANNSTVTKINQVDWNNYTFSGEAPYFITLDLTKTHIYWIDIEWLGVGSVRTGFVINGQFILAHTFHHANLETTTYMQTACLPIRYEIINTTNGSGGTLKQICSTVISEGGYEATSATVHGSTGLTSKVIANGSGNVFIPLVSMKLNTHRYDSIVLPSQTSIYSTTNDKLIYKILLNPTLTNATFANLTENDTSGNVIYDTAATALSGGTEINSGYIINNNIIALSSNKDFNMQMGKYFNGSAIDYSSDIITVATAKLDSTNGYSVAAMVGWYDIIK